MNLDGEAPFVLTKAISLTGKTLTVRAGVKADGSPYRPRLKGYANYSAPQALFHLTGAADLALENLTLSFEVPPKADGWAMSPWPATG